MPAIPEPAEPTAALPAAPAPLAPAPAAPAPDALAVLPTFASTSFLRSNSGATGMIAAKARLLARRAERKSVQRSQSRTWRRTGGVTRIRPSATCPSSRRTWSQLRRRASAASAKATRARTSSDLTLGIVVSIASAISV